MIAVDTSALMAVILDEAETGRCIEVLEAEPRLLISAGTVSEAMIVAARRHVADEMGRLLEGLGFEVVSITAASARRIADAYARWGRGVHPAALNFGDCFAYEIASSHGCPLLFVGGGFSRTDLASALV